MLNHLLILFSGGSFLCYGVSCLLSRHMREEFSRFGLSQMQRTVTGVFQLIGAFGLVTGLASPVVGLIAAIGLTVMMTLGWLVRLRIRDGLLASSPAFLYIVLNGYLSWVFLQQI